MALRIRRPDKGVGTNSLPHKQSREGNPAAKNSLVVFISDTPRSREAKLAYGLNSAGWDVVLLYRDAPTFDAEQDFIDARHYATPAEALRLAQAFRPRIYHLFSNWNFATASVVIRNKPGKVVFDNYDVLAGMVREEIAEKKYPGQLALERYCLEQADGLCCRSLETQVARRTMGYAYKGRRLFFPDYCWDDDVVTICRREPDTCRVANIGNLYIDTQHDIDHARNFHLKLALILEKHNIGSHLYKTSLDRDLATYFYRATRVSPMILLRNLSYGDLLKEVSQLCHAGLICAPKGITSEMNEIYRHTKRQYGTGNKAFDYVDAGLPIIMDRENTFLFWFIKRYHRVVGFSRFMDDVDGQMTSIKEQVARSLDRLCASRRALSIRHHIRRLVAFYEGICGNN